MKRTTNRTLFVLAAATSISLAPFAVSAADPVSTRTEVKTERDNNGNYVKSVTVEDKDSDGTKTSDTNEVKVKVDADGDYKKIIENKTVKDPKGLFNKSTVESTKIIKNDDGKYEDSNSTEIKNGVTGTKTTKESSVESKTNKAGDFEKTVETNVSTDPKGLMNKSSVKVIDKVEKKDGQNKYNYIKKVNGRTIEDKTMETE